MVADRNVFLRGLSCHRNGLASVPIFRDFSVGKGRIGRSDWLRRLFGILDGLLRKFRRNAVQKMLSREISDPNAVGRRR
jgi:hypothetical protein